MGEPNMGQPFPLAGSFGPSLNHSALAYMNNRALRSGLLAVALLTGADMLMAAETPTDAIRTTFERAVHVLKDQELKKPGRQQERLNRLEQAIGERVSYRELAKRSLGPRWKELSEKDKQEFVVLFAHLLRDTYASRILQYNDEQVEYLTERLDGSYAEVRTKVKGSKVNIPVDYRLINQSGLWRVYDVVVDGISMVSNYRGQFSKILQTSSYETLLERLRTRTISGSLDQPD
ncbi:MAG TPA: ABC transporter substrate-binding protein [Nitrospiraceae bacterium]|nr:ABC transporter substrate-binding protein [Nitrospiraceae bacterium]